MRETSSSALPPLDLKHPDDLEGWYYVRNNNSLFFHQSEHDFVVNVGSACSPQERRFRFKGGTCVIEVYRDTRLHCLCIELSESGLRYGPAVREVEQFIASLRNGRKMAWRAVNDAIRSGGFVKNTSRGWRRFVPSGSAPEV